MVSPVARVRQISISTQARLVDRPAKVTTIAQLEGILKERFAPSECRQFANRFTLKEKLGSGGQGIVYKAFDWETGQNVAVKINIDSYVDSLIEEAEVTAHISNPYYPHLPRFISAGEADLTDGYETFFLATEYIKGHSLLDEITASKMPLDRVLEVASQVCCGLWAASYKGVIHRDLKPLNILIRQEDNTAVIIDFGFASTKLFAGTGRYMAPEQFYLDEAELDPRSDIYTLGLVIHQMLSQRVPFEDVVSMEELTGKKFTQQSHLVPGITGSIQKLIDKATMLAREDRFQTYKEFYDEIERIRAEISGVEEEIVDLTAMFCDYIGPLADDAVVGQKE
ncbi:MAG: serine/threonine-protein kinase [Candidatus Margulisiibacteriota bacterium]